MWVYAGGSHGPWKNDSNHSSCKRVVGRGELPLAIGPRRGRSGFGGKGEGGAVGQHAKEQGQLLCARFSGSIEKACEEERTLSAIPAFELSISNADKGQLETNVVVQRDDDGEIFYGVYKPAHAAALSRTQTVGEVVEAMIKELGGAGAAPVAAAAAAPSSGSAVSPAKATEVVLAVLAAKTGYEPDMIEMDMALETELGVDSIKRVEILSDVQKELSVEAQDVAALSRTQTVGEVVEAMIAASDACTVCIATKFIPR